MYITQKYALEIINVFFNFNEGSYITFFKFLTVLKYIFINKDKFSYLKSIEKFIMH